MELFQPPIPNSAFLTWVKFWITFVENQLFGKVKLFSLKVFQYFSKIALTLFLKNPWTAWLKLTFRIVWLYDICGFSITEAIKANSVSSFLVTTLFWVGFFILNNFSKVRQFLANSFFIWMISVKSLCASKNAI